ncbi:hypothetical protein AAHC03_024285 [Spirometra sp. Aus1]
MIPNHPQEEHELTRDPENRWQSTPLVTTENNLNHLNSPTNSVTNEDFSVKPSSQVANRNWKGLMLALLVISAISALIILACFLTYDYKVVKNYGIPLTLDDVAVLNGLLNRPNAIFTKDHLVYMAENFSIIAIDIKTNQSIILLTNDQLREKPNCTGIFSVSDDMSAILLRYTYIPLYRRSFLSYYQAIFLSTDSDRRVLARIDISPYPKPADPPLLNHASFSSEAKAIAFVHKNQLYYIRNPLTVTPHEVVNVTAPIFTEGVLYGFAGFLYEEEILGTSKTFWWSPDSLKLAFTAIDERNVSKTKLFFYEVVGRLDGEVVDHSYPKAGEGPHYGIPIVTVYVHFLSTRETVEFRRPPEIPRESYLCYFHWINADSFVTGWVNREWSESWIVVGDCASRSMRLVYAEKVQFGWTNMPIQPLNMPVIEDGGQSLLIVAPNYYSKPVYRGIARLFLNESRVTLPQYPQWVHIPDYDVKDILYSYGDGEVLYLSSGPDPKEMHLFMSVNSTSAICLTCDDPKCSFSSARVSDDGQLVLHECQGLDVPTTALKRIRRSKSPTEGQAVYLETVALISNNSILKEAYAKRAMPVTKFEQVTIRRGTKEELTLEVKFMHPPELVETHIVTYPLLLVTYGGPVSQMVTKKLTIDWYTYLCATLKFVIVSIDGRGTGSRGKRFEAEIFKNFGTVEVRDQLDGLRQIVNTHKYVNKTKLCSFGWSYGGFTVANLLGHPENSFLNCGVAVAPVTDFRLYDSAYTEKFLGLFTENSHEYMRTRVSRLAANFRSKDFLIVHGMADDNVNFIHSALLVKELVRQGVDFQMMFYPDDNHFIIQKHFRQHLWRTVVNFIVDSVNRTSFRHQKLLGST